MVTNVASPVFSKLQGDRPRLSGTLLSLTRALAYVTYPALIGMLAVSHELIPVVLGAGWEEVQIPFAALCVMGLIKSVDPLLSQALISTGNAKKLSAYTLLCGLAMAPAVWVGASLDGLRGVSIVWAAVYPVLSIRLLTYVCGVTGLRPMMYYRNLLPVVQAACVMAAAVLLVRWVGLSAGVPVPPMLIVEVATGALTYALWIVYADRSGLTELRQIMLDIGISRNRLNRWPFTRCEQL
jgi:O-antigen/teichoic acid export membrane protein